MKRLKKGPQVLRSSKTQRDTKNLAGHKKNNARPKTQRHVKNLPELEKTSNTRFEEYFFFKHHRQGSNWILLTLTNVQSLMWRTIRFERENIKHIIRECCKLSRPYPSHLLNDSQRTEGHDGTIRYRLVILVQCGNWRVWGEGRVWGLWKFALYKNWRKK